MKMNKLTTGLISAGAFAPRASIGESLKDSWYAIRASGKGSAEITLYDEIGGWGISARQFAEDLKGFGNLSNLTLRIHSPGGDVFEGMAIYNLLDQHPAYIDGYIDGLAASMGSVVAMACDTIHMPENAMMMIHKPWGIQGGDADDMRRYADLLDKVEDTLVNAYTRKSGKGADEIKTLLSAETWFSGADAVEQGFADKLIAPLQAAAQLQSKRLKEFNHMPKSVEALMKPRAQGGQSAPAPAPITPAPQPTTPNDPPAAEPTSATLAAYQAAEVQRRTGIRSAFSPFASQLGAEYQPLLDSCLDDMTTNVEAARTQLLNALGAQSNDGGHPANISASVRVDNGNLIGDSVRASVQARIGQAKPEADNRFNNYTLVELARASLNERGIGTASMNRMQMVGQAFTHSNSDFGNILLDVAHKSMLAGWDNAEETYHLWTKKGILTDFKTHHRVGLGAFPSLRQVREGAEFKHITLSDRGESIVLATYGELFSLTRQVIINDDLEMLSSIPMKMGEAARGTIGDLVYAQLTSNPSMSDSKSLFHADHGNLGSGALSVTNLDAGRTAMRKQQLGDRYLNIRPAYVLTPVELEATARQIIRSASVEGAETNAGIDNPIRNFAEVISDPRLSESSESAWYLSAAQGRDTIEVAYLDGVDTPFMEQQEGFTVDGVISKVRIDAAAKPLDYRGMYKSTGS
jgi:ATP-dependent protease ClpP protease subunit/phage major head subunit gpT-like protein